jgi:hypothetical protein
VSFRSNSERERSDEPQLGIDAFGSVVQLDTVSPRERTRPQLKRTVRAPAGGVLSRNSSTDSNVSLPASSPIDIVDAVIAAASPSPLSSPPTSSSALPAVVSRPPSSSALPAVASPPTASLALPTVLSPNRPRKLTRTVTYRDYVQQIYQAECTPDTFFGEFAEERRTRNYKYHSNYSRNRQAFQDTLVRTVLSEGKQSSSPHLLFTAGAMGAGKGYALRLIAPQIGVNLLDYVKIDPDQIKEMLPEYQMLKVTDPSIAGSQCHQESGYIQELILERALKMGKNVVLDGSMRDWQWYLKEIERIQATYPTYVLDIVLVQASEETVMSRARERGKMTGRVIPPALLRDCIRQVPLSIDILKHAVRKTYFVNNDQVPFIESTFVSDRSGAMLDAILDRTKTQAERIASSFTRDTVMLSTLELSKSDLVDIASAMHLGIEKLGLPELLAFTGQSAVDWLVAQRRAVSRAEAVRVGQQMLEQGMLRHVHTSAAFGDSRELFRFLIDDYESKAKFSSAQGGALHISMAALDEDHEGSGIATLVLKMLNAEFERDASIVITIKRFATLTQYSEFAAQKRTELAKRFRPARLHNTAPLVWFSDGAGAAEEYVGGCTQLLIAILQFPKFARSRTIFNLRSSFFLRDLLPKE